MLYAIRIHTKLCHSNTVVTGGCNVQSGLVTLKPSIAFDRLFVDSIQMACVSNSWFAYTVVARMDAAATIIFRSGKMQRLFEGSYHLSYTYVRINSIHQAAAMLVYCEA